MLTPTMRSKIDTLWDRFWSGGIANPLSAMEQISYLLFMRRLDDQDRLQAENADFAGESFDSMFAGPFEWAPGRNIDKSELRWSHFRHLEGGDMLAHVRDKVFPFIKSLRGEDQPFSTYMKDAVFIIPKASLLVEAVGIIDEIYAEVEREREEGQTFHDTQGDLYEVLLSEIATAGKNGQFRTPRHIIQMIVELVDPRLGEQICDPACGTGGFLLGSYQHILKHHTTPDQRWTDEHGFERGLGDRLTDDRQWEVLREKTLHGFDFDTTMVRIGLMNLLLHGVTGPFLHYADGLAKLPTREDRRHIAEKLAPEQHDVILANPPFKGSIDKGDVLEELTLSSRKTELLFVERILQLLRIGGRAGVIVPDGVLFGSTKAHKALRKKLVDEAELQGVISMPSGVFKPYAGVSTAVLVFVKGGVTDKVWFYDMTADGYSLDDKRDRIDDNDVPDVIERWRKRDPAADTDRKAKAFYVPKSEIVDNKYDLSINRYKEIEYEQVEYDPPAVIIDRLEALQAEIAGDLKALRGML